MTPSPIWIVIEEKSGSPKTAAMSGVKTSATSDCTTTLNARPRMTATASSIRLPFEMNSLNSRNMGPPPLGQRLGEYPLHRPATPSGDVQVTLQERLAWVFLEAEAP